jgi:hypothetical protein
MTESGFRSVRARCSLLFLILIHKRSELIILSAVSVINPAESTAERGYPGRDTPMRGPDPGASGKE